MGKSVFFEKSVLIIFIITLSTGALRKWVFTSLNTGNIILLIQLILPFFISVNYKGISLPGKQNIIKFYILYLLISAINPLNLTIYHGILGIIQYLGFWWLISFYYENRQSINFRPLIPWIIILCSFEFILGIVQYQFPSDHILNKYASIHELGSGSSVAIVGDAVRITGTFSYISGFGSFLIFAMFFIWGLVRLGYKKQIVAFLLSGALITTLMTGSRTSVLIAFTFLILMFTSDSPISTIIGFLKSLLIPLSFLFLFFLLKGSVGTENLIEKAFFNFEHRRIENAQSGEQNQRILSDFRELTIEYRGKYPFLGVGLGATYQGATSVFGVSDYVKEYGDYENELPRIVLEAGFIMLFFRIVLFIWLFSWLEINWSAKIIFFFLFVYGLPIVFNIYNSIFLALGLIFLDNISIHRRLTGSIKYDNN